ncbi:MAG TPA: GNAT family N-acetyltransferase [Bdellovibrionota bacterium]|nr:GNAT family N-acetyltransferase [Bdellovibrionota bacterium]
MSDPRDFHRLVRLLAPYRCKEVVARAHSAELGPGTRGIECAAWGEDGIAELVPALRGELETYVHLWDDSPRAAGRELRALGFEELWTNELLEAGASDLRGQSQAREIRTDEELAALARVLEAAHAPRMSPPRIRALRSGEVAGASFAQDGEVVYAADVFVHPHHRHEGHGRGLLLALGSIAREEGCGLVWALPTRRARPFYAKLAFIPRARVTTYRRAHALQR